MGKRNKLQSNKSIDMSNSIVSMFEMHSKTYAHCLMELSKREWVRYKDSTIHVSGRVEDRSNKCLHIYYKDIIIGSNVCIIKKDLYVMEKLYGRGRLMYQK